RPPVLLLRGPAGRARPDLRHRAGLPGRELRVGPHGARHAGLPGQHRADLAVHDLLPLLPAHRRREAEALLTPSGALPDVAVGGAAQRAAHAAGLGVAAERGGRRPVRVPRGDRCLRRPAPVLTWHGVRGSLMAYDDWGAEE